MRTNQAQLGFAQRTGDAHDGEPVVPQHGISFRPSKLHDGDAAACSGSQSVLPFQRDKKPEFRPLPPGDSMQQANESHLSSDFLQRVKAVYWRAVTAGRDERFGAIWHSINNRRQDVHDALIADGYEALRTVFRNPGATDLFYGVANIHRGFCDGNFPASAFEDDGTRVASTRHQAALLVQFCSARSSIVEIGPGLGRTAYYAYMNGLCDYTTIDLPLGIAAQACFLGATLGPDCLWFEGESPAAAASKIKIHFSKPNRRFDVALNVDSMTEMPPSVAFDYVAWLADRCPLFISINHAMNLFTVAEVMRFAGCPRTAQKKCPAPPGGFSYDEEIFQLRRISAFPPRQIAFRGVCRARLEAIRIKRFVHKCVAPGNTRHVV